MKKILLILFIIFSATLTFCGGDKRPRVVVLGFDGADWNFIEPLIAKGKLPHFKHLRENGATARLQSFRPSISAVIWTSISTGMTMVKHGIVSWTYLKEKGIEVPYNNSEVREPPLWEILSQNKKRSVVVNWYNTFPAEPINGVVISDHARRLVQLKDPKLLAEAAYPKKYISLVNEEIERDAGLARRRLGLPDYEAWTRAKGYDPKTVPVVRDLDLYLLHENLVEKVSRRLFENEEYDFFAAYFRFPDNINHFVGMFLSEEMKDEGVLQITAQKALRPEFRERLYGAYADLLLPTYEWLDHVLGTYLERLRKNDYLVLLSDHGFAWGPQGFDHQLPEWMGAAPGVFAIVGPQAKKGFVVPRLSVFDVAPTLLYLYDLPVNKKMDGRVAREIFTFDRPVRSRSYFRPSFIKKHRSELDQATLEELRSLGYIQ